MKLLMSLVLLVHMVAWGQSRDNGVILLYHHVSDKTPASTSISPTLFKQHMQMLASGYQVMPLSVMVKQLRAGRPLPDKAVAISFDDGYANIYQNAHPILQEYKFPYTVFINPKEIGRSSSQLTWLQIKSMIEQGAEFANHTNTHDHLLARLQGESEKRWLSRRMADIDAAQALMEQHIGQTQKLFAYPYGEYNQTLKQAITKAGYIGFGQQSGAIASYSDFAALPRFPAAGIYANPKTLKTKLDSLAMPVSKPQAHIAELAYQQQPSPRAIQVNTEDMYPKQLSCFQQGQLIATRWQQNDLYITLGKPIKPGRSRVNCTAPSRSAPGRYYWYSLPWFMPTKQGKWLE